MLSCFLCLALSVSVHARAGSPRPVRFPVRFRPVNFTFTDPYRAKVCACQLLQVSSNNQPYTFIAVFAEAANKGNSSLVLNAADLILEKEKKHLRNFFFSSVRTAKMTAISGCEAMTAQVREKYESVTIYSVLDADALTGRPAVNP